MGVTIARRVLRLGCDRVRQCRAAKLQRRAQRPRRGDVCVGHEGHEVLPRSQRHAGRAGGRDAAGGVDGVCGERQRASGRDCLCVGVVEHSVFICRCRPGRPLRAGRTDRALRPSFTALALRSLRAGRALNALRANWPLRPHRPGGAGAGAASAAASAAAADGMGVYFHAVIIFFVHNFLPIMGLDSVIRRLSPLYAAGAALGMLRTYPGGRQAYCSERYKLALSCIY